jgi:hypothetical protein
MQWRPIPLNGEPELDQAAIRLNSLGSLAFFISFTLKRNKLSRLHDKICRSLEREHLRLVLELPRWHYKTTLVAEGLPMWWALPFTPMDEELMRQAGYDDAWIRWMRYAHDRDTSTLLIAETEKNTVLNGTLIDHHYQNNDLFRWIFPEIIPDGTTTWNNEIKIHRRSPHVSEIRKEGTYHYRGVGQAVTGLHPARAIEDDLFGLEAQQSEAVAEATIRYHRMLGGVIGDGDNVVDGNRWSVADLDGWIRENDKTFAIESHSALGGCCEAHPAGQPLFPEEWPLDKLEYQRKRMGDYDFSHQFLNLPVIEGDCVFRPEWLREYRFKQSHPELPLDDPGNWLFIEHEVVNGKVIADYPCNAMEVRMVIDPNHAGKKGRCKHAITVTCLDTETDNFYLLDAWSNSCGYTEFVEEIYRMGEKWGLREAWLETVASQIYLKYYLDEKNNRVKRPLRFRELPKDNRANAKDRRIESLEPIFRNGNFWYHASQTNFRQEYASYYRGKMVDVDILDTIAYCPQLFDGIRRQNNISMLRQRAADFKERRVGTTGY